MDHVNDGQNREHQEGRYASGCVQIVYCVCAPPSNRKESLQHGKNVESQIDASRNKEILYELHAVRLEVVPQFAKEAHLSHALRFQFGTGIA